MTNRKINLTFHLGKLNGFDATNWYLLIDRDNAPVVEMMQMRGFANWMASDKFGRTTSESEKDAICRSYFSANEKNSIAHINGKLLGCICQKTGGYCTRLAMTFATKVVEFELPSDPNDAVIDLWKAWPFMPERLADLEKHCTYSQFEGGTHWYARLPSGEDVEVDGRSKWDTKSQATSAVRAYIAMLAQLALNQD